jgi:hypothetical protein
MFSVETITLIIQAGVAGVFAVFAIIAIKLFLDFLREERAQRLQIMVGAQQVQSQMLVTLTKLNENIDAIQEDLKRHDRGVSRKLDDTQQRK